MIVGSGEVYVQLHCQELLDALIFHEQQELLLEYRTPCRPKETCQWILK